MQLWSLRSNTDVMLHPNDSRREANGCLVYRQQGRTMNPTEADNHAGLGQARLELLWFEACVPEGDPNLQIG